MYQLSRLPGSWTILGPHTSERRFGPEGLLISVGLAISQRRACSSCRQHSFGTTGQSWDLICDHVDCSTHGPRSSEEPTSQILTRHQQFGSLFSMSSVFFSAVLTKFASDSHDSPWLSSVPDSESVIPYLAQLPGRTLPSR